MKVTYYALAFMVFVTTMVGIVQAMGFNPQPMTPYDPSEIADALNASAIIAGIDPEDQDFYDVGSGLITFWNMKVPLVESAIDFFDKLGTPDELIALLLVPWRFFWVGFVISFWSGRDFMP